MLFSNSNQILLFAGELVLVIFHNNLFFKDLFLHTINHYKIMWEEKDNKLIKNFIFSDFQAAFAFMTRVVF